MIDVLFLYIYFYKNKEIEIKSMISSISEKIRLVIIELLVFYNIKSITIRVTLVIWVMSMNLMFLSFLELKSLLQN